MVEHQETCGLGELARWLPRFGLRPEPVRPYLGEPLPDRPAALLVLGGGMSAWQDDRAPWLPATRELLRRAVGDGVPTLGICLGAQLLTLACGGRVRPAAELAGAAPEVGVVELGVRAAGDPLLGGLPGRVRAVQWHYDATAQPPPGAVVLAGSRDCRYQAYRLGERAWAVQFHPEATGESLTAWAASDPGGPAAAGTTIAAVLAEYADRRAELGETARTLARAFSVAARA